MALGARAAGGLVLVGLGAGVLVAAVPVMGDGLRETVTFRPGRPSTVSLLATNGRLVLTVLVAAVLVARMSWLRTPVDLAVGLLAVINAGAIGAIVGAFGPRLLLRLPHLPFELAGIAVALATYLRARDGEATDRWLAGCAVGAVGCIAVGALIEARWSPGRWR